MDDNQCKNCDGQCCKYITVYLVEPKSEEDFEEIKWFVSHKNVSVYLDEDDEWCVEFLTECKFLKNNSCIIYERRPKICKDYNTKDCTFKTIIKEKVIFRSIEDVERYVQKKFKENEDKEIIGNNL